MISQGTSGDVEKLGLRPRFSLPPDQASPSVFNTSLGTLRMFMNRKSCLIPILGSSWYRFWVKLWTVLSWDWPGAVAQSEACSLDMQAAPSSIPTSGTFFRGDLVMKTFLRPSSLFRWFKKSSCQLLAKECALSTGKLPRRLAQEQCG